MNALERFDDDFKPQESFREKGYDMTTMPDGEVSFTILEAVVKESDKKRELIFEMELQIDTGPATGNTTQKAYFLDKRGVVGQVGVDLLRLGFPTDCWDAKHGKKFSTEFPLAVKRLAGMKFRAVKKNSDPVGEKKTVYANLTFVERIGPMPPESPPDKATRPDGGEPSGLPSSSVKTSDCPF